jgi:hypothetical protein
MAMTENECGEQQPAAKRARTMVTLVNITETARTTRRFGKNDRQKVVTSFLGVSIFIHNFSTRFAITAWHSSSRHLFIDASPSATMGYIASFPSSLSHP